MSASYEQGVADGLESFAEALEFGLAAATGEVPDGPTVTLIAALARTVARSRGTEPHPA